MLHICAHDSWLGAPHLIHYLKTHIFGIVVNYKHITVNKTASSNNININTALTTTGHFTVELITENMEASFLWGKACLGQLVTQLKLTQRTSYRMVSINAHDGTRYIVKISSDPPLIEAKLCRCPAINYNHLCRFAVFIKWGKVFPTAYVELYILGQNVFRCCPSLYYTLQHDSSLTWWHKL